MNVIYISFRSDSFTKKWNHNDKEKDKVLVSCLENLNFFLLIHISLFFFENQNNLTGSKHGGESQSFMTINLLNSNA